MRFLLCFSFSFGLAFLSFTWFLLLTPPAVPCFFSSCFFILAFTPIKDLGLYGPNNIDWIKRVLGQICLYLLKSFCWKTVFCGRSVFCCKFVICCKSAFCCRSAADLYSFFGPFFLFDLLGGPLGLDFYWAFFLMGFWIWIRKNGHQQSVNSSRH